MSKPSRYTIFRFYYSQHSEHDGHLSERTNLNQKTNMYNVLQSNLTNNKYCTYHFEEIFIGVIIFHKFTPTTS